MERRRPGRGTLDDRVSFPGFHRHRRFPSLWAHSGQDHSDNPRHSFLSGPVRRAVFHLMWKNSSPSWSPSQTGCAGPVATEDEEQRGGNSHHALLPSNLLFHFGHHALPNKSSNSGSRLIQPGAAFSRPLPEGTKGQFRWTYLPDVLNRPALIVLLYGRKQAKAHRGTLPDQAPQLAASCTVTVCRSGDAWEQRHSSGRSCALAARTGFCHCS